MTRRAREVETLLLTMFAALPLYVTNVIGTLPVLAFHAAMGGIVVRVLRGKGPDLIPARIMRGLALAYVPFYFIDWRMLGGSAIAASTHLVLFIAFYQPIESLQRNNQAQRMLTTALIFVASLATSTHIMVLPFVVVFAYLTFRQLMYTSHLETVRSVERPYDEAPSGRAAVFYLGGAVLIGVLLFPLLPRVRNPFVQGIMGSLPGGATALSETIDFSEPRLATPDATIVARVWMDREARAFFTPIRLRGSIYDRYSRGAWQQGTRGLREVPSREGTFILGRRSGVERGATVQQRPSRGKLFLPVGTYSVSGLPARLYEGPRDSYSTYVEGAVNLSVRMSYATEPLRLVRVATVNYPVSAEIAALARSIVRDEQRPGRQAALIENYLSRNFRYLPNNTPANATLGTSVSVEDFLLRTRAGHCEYFAAGMVVLLTALDVPARIAGGFYGGRLNPLTGYYVLRRDDAHAWTEVWDGARWMTFDATPTDLRPGMLNVNPLRDYLAAVTDSLNFAWDRYILTFSLGDQLTLAEELIAWTREKAAQWREALRADAVEASSPEFLAVAALLLLAGAIAIFLAQRRRPLFDVLARHLAARGIEVGPAMTMEEALRELRAHHPDAAREIEPLVALYEEEQFSPRKDRGRAKAIRRKLRELRA